MNIALAFRLARRELRSGFSGFRIFFASLVLGVMAIAAVESLSDAFLTGLAQQGQVLLGGDLSVSLVHRETTPAEHAFSHAIRRRVRNRVDARDGLRDQKWCGG